MSTANQERALVERLGKAQIVKLAVHSDSRVHWREWGEDGFYFDRLREELVELGQAIADGQEPWRVWNEAADVANFAAMLADRYESRADPEAGDE